MRLNNAVFAPPALSKEKDMGGFNYGGGKGDGTDWSSEKGDTPNPVAAPMAMAVETVATTTLRRVLSNAR
ncbi:hypothetical protein I5L02_01400 [Serratia marcescens]|nr:hypothetical protein [Serratia marcescens]